MPTIKTYEEYCAKLTSDPTLKKFAAEIKNAQKLGPGFFRGENPNPLLEMTANYLKI